MTAAAHDRFRSLLLMPALLLALTSCRRQETAANSTPEGGLARVGSITIHATDLDYYMQERYANRTDAEARRMALAELVRRAQFAQAALDAGLDSDPVVRQEMARLLEARLRELQLFPKVKAAATISETRLRELYQESIDRFQSPERRQVAVLWLDPGRNPEREKAYIDKLTQARDWLLNDSELSQHPDKGFAVLGVDYSEHQATRFKGGVVGWLEEAGGMDAWHKAVAEIAFAIADPGAVSPVAVRPEGVFLVRLMARKAAVLMPFESVATQLEQEDRNRIRERLESAFNRTVEEAQPVRWLTAASPGSPSATRTVK